MKEIQHITRMLVPEDQRVPVCKEALKFDPL